MPMDTPDRASADTRRRIAGHVANLGSPDDKTALDAEWRLIRFAAKAVDALLAAAADPRPQVRYRAVWALGQSGAGRAFPVICALTEDEDEAVRYDATLALGELGDPRAVPFLEELAQRITPEDSRLGPALSALGKLGGGDPDWTRFIACAWYEELADVREDIHTLEDGEPIDAARAA
jgi:hypothetical protein